MSRPNDFSDLCTRLLRRAQKGDVRSFGELYVSLKPVVTRYVKSFDRNLPRQDAEDVVQEVFLKAWQALASFRGDASAKTFILTITRHAVLNELSRRVNAARWSALVKTVVSPTSFRHHDRPAALYSEELLRRLYKAINRLTDKQRQAIELDQLLDLPRPDAARLAGCSREQFADRLYRAKMRIRQALGRRVPSVPP